MRGDDFLFFSPFFFLSCCQSSSGPLHVSDDFGPALIEHRTVFCLAVFAQLGPITAAVARMSHPPCHNPSSALRGDINQPGLTLKGGEKTILKTKKKHNKKQKWAPASVDSIAPDANHMVAINVGFTLKIIKLLIHRLGVTLPRALHVIF